MPAAVTPELARAPATVVPMELATASRAGRLARLRALDQRLTLAADLPTRHGFPPSAAGPRRPVPASLLATALGGWVEPRPEGALVVVERRMRLPLDLAALASLPLDIDPRRRLVLLDTETTGLGTAAGTMAFLIGVGWWTDDTLVVRQLWLPDQPAEAALLTALEAILPACSQLVTYNGRTFDWPLLVARFRLQRRAPPTLAGHLDLLPVARRLWRHRLADARLSTVEAGVAGVRRLHDLPGALMPEQYFAYLRGGSPARLVAVGRHNHEDIVSMARLLQVLADQLAAPAARREAHPGDVAALARLLRRRGLGVEAIACYDDALLACEAPRAPRAVDVAALAFERARLLARVGRRAEARAAWLAITAGGGRAAILAWVALAKDLEHHRRDAAGALTATVEAERLLARRRALGLFMPELERDLPRRARRLRARLARLQAPAISATAARVRSTSSAVL